MSENVALEDRLTAMERDLAELRAHVFRDDRKRPWFEKMVGTMRDYPEFAEVVRLGREIRKADAPK